MFRITLLTISMILFSRPGLSQMVAQAQQPQPKPALSDDELWKWYEKWTTELKMLPPGQTMTMTDAAVAQGMPRQEAVGRFQRINRLSRASIDRERTYWNGVFKLGGGPSAPLRLLQEALKNVKPGVALDMGMGRGRNTIYLAVNGWQVYGYDMAPDAILSAQAAAKEAGVKINTTVARHEEFDFGESKWDLIICAYCYARSDDPHWPPVFLKTLKPGGIVVFQEADTPPQSWATTVEIWKQFRILRLEDEDPGYIDDDYLPSRIQRTVRLVARKD